MSRVAIFIDGAYLDWVQKEKFKVHTDLQKLAIQLTGDKELYQALNTKYQKLLTNDRQLTADKFNLQGAYNNTLANYNNLQSAVAKYNASLKTTSTRVNCNSFTYGINNQFTSTSCN